MEKESFVESFFVASMIDLQNRRDGNIYDLIRAAGIIRQLLIDSNPLLSQANKRHRLKITFTLRDNAHELAKNHEQWWGRALPNQTEKNIQVDREKLLQYPICIYKHHTYAIRDMIDYFCHILGGIHSGKVKDDKQKTFTVINRAFFPIIEDWLSVSIKQIIQVVINGLIPLIEAIENNRHTPKGGF